MKVIGLTGSIGSGKSTVATFFSDLGAKLIDADKVARKVVEPGKPALKKLVESFGETILKADGTLDRKLVAEIVFSSEDKREILNNIIHPAIYDHIQRSIESYKKKGAEIVIIEAALLLEKKGLIKLTEKLIVVSVDEDTQKKRLISRGDLSREQIDARINSQISNSEKIKHADIVIDNSGDLEKTREQVVKIWSELT